VVLKSGGDLAGAVASYRGALRLDPGAAGAYSNLGNALTDLGLTGEAVACLETALSIRPEWPEVLTNLGRALRADGRLAAAAATLRRAVALAPRSVLTWNNLGNTLAAQGSFDRIHHAMTHGYSRAHDFPRPGFAAGPCLWKDTLQLSAFHGNTFLLGKRPC
jgi:Flp pilus assembly protein TadD